MVGITNERISLLDKIEDEDILDKLKGNEEDRNQASFSEHLQKISSRIKSRNK